MTNDQLPITNVKNSIIAKTEIKDWTIAVLAVLIVFQTIVLVGSNKFISTGRYQTEKMEKQVFPPSLTEEIEGYSVSLAFTPSEVSLKQGQTTSVDLVLIPKREIQLDGMDIVLTFDPGIIEISQMITPKLFSFVSEKKEKEKQGKVYVTFLEEKQNGLLINQEVKLLTLSLKGKSKGTTALSILISKEGPTTVITESGTSRRISFGKTDLPMIIY